MSNTIGKTIGNISQTIGETTGKILVSFTSKFTNIPEQIACNLII